MYLLVVTVETAEVRFNFHYFFFLAVYMVKVVVNYFVSFLEFELIFFSSFFVVNFDESIKAITVWVIKRK